MHSKEGIRARDDHSPEGGAAVDQHDGPAHVALWAEAADHLAFVKLLDFLLETKGGKEDATMEDPLQAKW